jgi:hypothetical protein
MPHIHSAEHSQAAKNEGQLQVLGSCVEAAYPYTELQTSFMNIHVLAGNSSPLHTTVTAELTNTSSLQLCANLPMLSCTPQPSHNHTRMVLYIKGLAQLDSSIKVAPPAGSAA